MSSALRSGQIFGPGDTVPRTEFPGWLNSLRDYQYGPEIDTFDTHTPQPAYSLAALIIVSFPMLFFPGDSGTVPLV